MNRVSKLNEKGQTLNESEDGHQITVTTTTNIKMKNTAMNTKKLEQIQARVRSKHFRREARFNPSYQYNHQTPSRHGQPGHTQLQPKPIASLRDLEQTRLNQSLDEFIALYDDKKIMHVVHETKEQERTSHHEDDVKVEDQASPPGPPKSV
jgi:hypothetical protein